MSFTGAMKAVNCDIMAVRLVSCWLTVLNCLSTFLNWPSTLANCPSICSLQASD
jgi:hypothetical protein